MTLYNLRSDGTITKWDSDGNIQAQYSVTILGCTCPAGHRHTCRHRQMLPDLLPIVDTHWFWDWTYKQVTDFQGHPKYLLDKLTEPAPVDLPAEQNTISTNGSVRDSRCDSDPAQAVSHQVVTPIGDLVVSAGPAQLTEQDTLRLDEPLIIIEGEMKNQFVVVDSKPTTALAPSWRRL